MSGTGRARRYTRRNPVHLVHVFIVDAIDAKRAFLHDTFIGVIFTRTIRASPTAQFAADADGPAFSSIPPLIVTAQ